jgi:DivIVA domain-containing protein
MKITPQDIIDKEFRVKFRGFDMVEVDIFLEEVAENFFKLSEENTRLNEKVLALQKDMESGGRIATQGQMELPAELGNFLEELKQDTAAINAELVSLKQDRSTFISLEKSIKEAVASLQKAVSAPPPMDKTKLPAGLENLGEFLQETKKISGELAALKQEVGSIQQIREEIKNELQGLLKSHFDDLGAKFSKAAPVAVPAEAKPEAAPSKKQKEQLAAAIIQEEPEGQKEDTRLPDFEEQDETSDDKGLEFLSEDDILDVDKLRGVFQSVLDESVSDGPNSRDDDDTSADLLFLEDSIIEDEHEPEVMFSLDEENSGKKSPKKEKTK